MPLVSLLRMAAGALAVFGILGAPVAFAAEPWRLTPAEVALVRAKGEVRTKYLFQDFATRAVLMRVFARLGGGSTSRIDGFEQPVFLSMRSYFSLSDMEAAIVEDGRFLVGMGCHDGRYTCGDRSWFVIDTRSGDVAAALAHDYDNNTGEELDVVSYTVFAMRCADAALRDYAMKIAREGAELIAYDAGLPASEAPPSRLIQVGCR